VHSRVINGLVAAGSCVLALAICELGLRSVVRVALPPLRIINPAGLSVSDREEQLEGITVDDKKITVGDLWGYLRLDPILGYTTKENAISVNDWWQSNNIGARSRRDTSFEIPADKRRVLLFGESFGAGTRLRQEETWSSLLEDLDPGTEVVNLAVDGYSMGQAYLRYLSVSNHLEYNNVVMMFVPEQDLWRDVNTVRDLVSNWNFQIVEPRFVIETGHLKLVPSPYTDPMDIFSDNRERLSERLRHHLQRYDRFYFRSLYESPPLIGRLWIYKILASAYGHHAKEAMYRDLEWPGSVSEAMQVSHEIFSAMQEQAMRNRTQFALIILPSPNELFKYFWDPHYLEARQAMTEFICADLRFCIDLALPLQMIPLPEIDLGYDGSHYGPRMHRRIAKAILAEFARHGFLKDARAQFGN
jgi:hypothetical protein